MSTHLEKVKTTYNLKWKRYINILDTFSKQKKKKPRKTSRPELHNNNR
jgi:hypothetical protein